MPFTMKAANLKNILVLMPTVGRSERLKLDGILAAAGSRRSGIWNVELETETLPARELKRQVNGFDGLIAYVLDDRHRRTLSSLRIPTVLIEDITNPRHPVTTKNVSSLICDHMAEGETAATHYLARNFTSFAFVGTVPLTDWSELRRTGFERRLHKAGIAPAVYPCDTQPTNFADERPHLSSWLLTLPHACAVFAACDYRARQVLAAAKAAGLSVPDDLAILGVDDDEVFCTTTSPALSSVQTEDVLFGQTAADLLDRLMSKPGRAGKVVRIRHETVTTRTSTDADALHDPVVARTLQYVRSHLDERLDADSLARNVGYSKRMLQLRVEKSLGTSLGKAVRNIRLAAARQLIVGSPHPLSEIASRCGFASASHLTQLIKSAFGKTPLELRHSSTLRIHPGTRTQELHGVDPA